MSHMLFFTPMFISFMILLLRHMGEPKSYLIFLCIGTILSAGGSMWLIDHIFFENKKQKKEIFRKTKEMFKKINWRYFSGSILMITIPSVIFGLLAAYLFAKNNNGINFSDSFLTNFTIMYAVLTTTSCKKIVQAKK